MSHDPRTKKCKGCGRTIGYGAYCGGCRKARRATGMWRKRGKTGGKGRRASRVLFAATSAAGGQITCHPLGVVANPITPASKTEPEVSNA